jgi:hypothetical protein
MSDDRCYRNRTGDNDQAIYNVNDPYVCPGTESANGNSRCCGASGICLGNGICQSLNPPDNGTGYYIGSCTDREYEDREVCSNDCSSLRVADIVYNKTEDIWYCCGLTSDGNLRCNNPTTQTVAAPSPAALLQQYSASSVSFMSTASSTSLPAAPTDTVQSPIPTESNSGDSEGLSTGSQVGIGVSVSVAAIAIFAVVWFLLRSRRKQRMWQAGAGVYSGSSQNGYNMMNTSGTTYQKPYNGSLGPEQMKFTAYTPYPAHTQPAPAPAELSPHEQTATELMSSTRRNLTVQELPS